MVTSPSGDDPPLAPFRPTRDGAEEPRADQVVDDEEGMRQPLDHDPQETYVEDGTDRTSAARKARSSSACRAIRDNGSPESPARIVLPGRPEAAERPARRFVVQGTRDAERQSLA